MSRDLDSHPCFDGRVRHKYSRIHLPVARSCNVQCRYCNRKYDCVNESRPGVSSVVLSPTQASAYLRHVLAHDKRATVVGIAGPGDPLADAAATLETLDLVRASYPDILLCIATNGLKLPELVPELARLRVSHVTVTVNAVDPAIGALIYAWVRDGNRPLRGEDGAVRLLASQTEGIARLKEHGITVKVNAIVIPGINDGHVIDVAKTVAGLGADIMNCIPIYPVSGSEWAAVTDPPAAMIARIRKAAERFLPQMRHCTRCRADAAGLVGETTGQDTFELLERFSKTALAFADDRPHVAVASMEGVLVNQHLGEATHLWIFGRENGRFHLADTRDTPPPGGGSARWEQLSTALDDCRAILVSGAGESPRTILSAHGVEVLEMEGLIESALQAIYGGGEVTFPVRRARSRCGVDCAGGGQGCG